MDSLFLHNNYSFTITYFDESGLWQAVWNSLKDQLNIHFASIKFKDNLNSMKTLSSLNIKMQQKSDYSQLHLYIIKINSLSELKSIGKEKIIANFEKYKNSFYICLMNIEGSDSEMKNSLKIFEKIKTELKNPDFKLLPINISYSKHNNIISDFFVFFKLRISTEISQKIIYFTKQIESYKQNKFDKKESVYNYLSYKINLYGLLQLGDFWLEILKLSEDDLFVTFNHLEDAIINNVNQIKRTNSIIDIETTCNPFNEPFSLLDFDENLIYVKINNKKISNIEYQQFLLYQLFKSCKCLRDFRKLNFYILKLFSEVSGLKMFFNSKYNFYFWCYQFTCRLVPFIKSLKSGIYSLLDEELNIRSQINAFYNMKKCLKNFAMIVKCEIPGIKIFGNLIKNDFISEETGLKSNIEFYELNSTQKDIDNQILENDINYTTFIKEVQENLDEKSKAIIFDKKILLEEYLIIMNNLEKLHESIRQTKLAMKIKVEKLPLLFILNKKDEIRLNLLSIIGCLKTEKWDFLIEIFNFTLIILINCMDKSEENLKIIMEFLNVKFKKEKEMKIIFNIQNDYNSIYEILSNYLRSYGEEKKLSEDIKIINMNDILKLKLRHVKDFDDSHNPNFIYTDIININLNEDKIGLFSLTLQNLSKLKFQISKIVLNFIDEDDGLEIYQDYFNEQLQILNDNTEITHLIKLDFQDISNQIESFRKKTQNKNFTFSFSSIAFILNSNLRGVYKFDDQNLKINLKRNNLEISSKIEKLNQSEQFGYFYNTLYSLFIELKNFNEFDFSQKILKISIVNTDINTDMSQFKLKKNKFIIKNSQGEKLNEQFLDKVIIKNDEILFSENILFTENLIYLEVFFVVEDCEFYKSKNKQIELITNIIDTKTTNNDNNNEKKFFFKETQHISLEHIFSLTNKLRVEKNDNILIQTSISLNLNQTGVRIYSDPTREPIELDVLQTFNLVKFIKINSEYTINDVYDINFDFDCDFKSNKRPQRRYTFCYPEEIIKEKINLFNQLAYHIIIDVDYDKESDDDKKMHKDGLQLFQEFNLAIVIRKYLIEDVLIMIKINDNINWSVIGKSKILIRISQSTKVNQQEKSKKFIEIKSLFRLIPLHDGYIKLPEIDFMEYKINSSNVNDLNNINSLEFLPLNSDSIIQGNSKVLKVYSIDSCALRLNFI